MIITPKELPTLLASRRKALGLSLREVSELTGVSASTLSRMENDAGNDAATLDAVAKWVGVTVVLGAPVFENIPSAVLVKELLKLADAIEGLNPGRANYIRRLVTGQIDD